MNHVARAAGVSLKTVSRVVNNDAGVHPDTYQRVNAVIETLGFRRNEFARQLRTGLTSTLGLIIEDIANPFYSQIARGVEEVAREFDCIVITVSCEEGAEREKSLVEALVQRRVDGLLLVPASEDHRYLEAEVRRGTAVVFLDRPPGQLEADTVLLENRQGTRRGVQHLIARGHRRIGFLSGFPQVYTGAERLAGYREALLEAGISFEPELLSFEAHDAQQAEREALRLLSLPHPPSAIFAASNRQSLGVIRAVHRSGQHTELVGFDDFELADVVPGTLNVLRYDAVEMGRLAARLLFSRLEQRHAPNQHALYQHTQYQHYVVPVDLVTRGMGTAG